MDSRILIVDDDHAILELITSLLEIEGYRVQAFDSAPLALQAALEDPPDAAIVDLMMPEMNGHDLIEALRHDPRTHALPIVICSAYYGDLRRTILKLEPNRLAHIRKPFSIEDLLAILRQMTSASGQGQASDGESLAGSRYEQTRVAAG